MRDPAGERTLMDSWAPYAAVPVLYALLGVVHVVLPGTRVEGYVSVIKPKSDADADGARGLPYVLNGLRTLFVTIAVYAIATVATGGRAPLTGAWWIDNFRACAISCCVSGLLFSAYWLVRAHRNGSYVTQPGCASSLAPNSTNALVRRCDELYTGCELNPRFQIGAFPFDVKMYLYLIGAVLLELFVLSATYRHWDLRASSAAAANDPASSTGGLSNTMLFYAAAMSWFVAEYLWHERIHLYTWDIFAENVGFKLVWGCFCFYPVVYCAGCWALVAHPAAARVDAPAWLVGVWTLLFGLGWVLTRGANVQKYRFKIAPHERAFPWLPVAAWQMAPRTIPALLGSADQRQQRVLLCSGFWSLARHINYLGETLQSVATALPATYVALNVAPGAESNGVWLACALAWAYPLYYVGLFVGRERADAVRCAAKYGAATWDAYCAAVPYRIVPYVY